MNLLKNMRGWLGRLPYEEPIQRRLAPILQYIFFGLIIASVTGVLLLVPLYGARALVPASVLPNLSFALVMAGGLALLRRGHFNTAIWVLIGFLLIGQAVIFAIIGFRDTPETRMLSVITLTLAALVLNRRALLVTLVLTLLISVFFNYSQPAAVPEAEHLSLVSSVILLTLLSLVLDLFGQTFRVALADATEREKRLEAEIEARKQTEVSLTESEARFRTMSDTAPVLIWMDDTKAERSFVNRQWLDFTGRQVEQEVGEGWLDGVHPDDYQELWDRYTTAFEKHELFSLEFRLRRKDGVYCWVLVNGAPRILEDGTFAGYIGSVVDISTRVEAEERTRLLQSLMDALSSTLATDEVVEVFTNAGLNLLDGQVGVIGLVNDDGDLDVVAQEGADVSEEALDFACALLADVVLTQKPVWIENSRAYAGSEGRAGTDLVESAVALPLVTNRRLIGAIAYCFTDRQIWGVERQAFLKTVAQQYAQAVERAQLHRQAQQTAAVAERQRLARELHDAVSQTLFSATTLAEGLPRVWERDPERGRGVVNELITLNRAAMSEMRALLLELRPEAILRNRLSTLLQQLVEAAKGRKGIDGTITIEGDDQSLNSTQHLTVYRIAQESVNNILRHSQADAFSMRLKISDEAILLEIADTGIGFNAEKISAGLGLTNIRERAESSGGTAEVVSSIEGGTRITARWMRQGKSA